ncbi:MAG: 50S ribosomal protein L6 [Berkelbacteria bacterium GW2011_GWA1_36_9]|uniref:Large ribosomal subunit protein uL6 n=1 Tax=Berkelbacteria bacterium GW2011_GWA1_36_9 TaxID=1618331 RepID=A0A0G0I1T5_9BACT|nr:MAG: 50S ribosomal protein L6 [Berkelbacteria bacterium GW2011_GWA1_36_9]
MSKIGQRQINIPEGVRVEKDTKLIKVTGPKGELTLAMSSRIKLEQSDNTIQVTRSGNDKKAKAFHGLYRKLIANMIEGVSQGFTKKLDFKGVGFKAEVQGNKLILNVGFSHSVEHLTPDGIEIKVEKNVISVSGINRQKVGQVAAEIRSIKPVEPYKGKGIKYIDEIPRRKPGKAAKAAIGGAK